MPPHILKRPSREENLPENLCDLPLFFRGQAHSEAPSGSFMGSDLHMSRSRPANSDRGSLKQSNPILLRGLENEKPQSESLSFSGNLRSHEGATGKTRIITELAMPVQDAFDACLS